MFGEKDNRRAVAYVGLDVDGGTGKAANVGTEEEEEGGERTFNGVDVLRALRGGARKYTYHPRVDGDWGCSCDDE